MSRKIDRFRELRTSGFTPLEARELSKLPKSTPALKAMIQDRIERRARFEKIAATKIAKGKWRRGQVGGKWLDNLSRLYSKKGWRVQQGPTGRQQKMPKKGINPWAMYRSYEKDHGGPKGKGYVSPWEVKQISQGTTRLEKGLIFVQQVEKKAKTQGGLNPGQIQQWITQKEAAISKATGKRKEQLIIEKNRLERLL